MYRIEEHDDQTVLVSEPEANTDFCYTYADYLKWRIEDRLELFRGRIYKMSGPNRIHQQVSGNIFLPIANYLKGRPCQIFSAPFDVRLPIQNKQNDNEIITVVQPDLCVICDTAKLDERGCCGAPDLVVEILSPGNSQKEVRFKFELYEEAGVKEYWLVHPVEQTLIAYFLEANGKFGGGKMYAPGDLIISTSIDGLIINLEEIFKN